MAADLGAAQRAHGHHPLVVTEVVDETPDTRTFVLGVPDDLGDVFAYEAGQFCTFRVTVDGEELYRSYSMSTAPALGEPLAVTVKRVPGGRVSGWLHDQVSPGQVLEVSPPTGVFRLGDGDRPVVAFAGGSGVTPVMSIIKTALATTDRPVRLLDANRDAASIIFREQFDELAATHADRFAVHHHLDDASGFLDAGAVRAFLGDTTDVDVFICGPAPFMDLVEATVLTAGVDPERVHLERFVNEPDATPTGGVEVSASEVTSVPEVVTVILKGKTHEIGYHPGDTILETTRRGALTAPSSCEAGNCATCMALCKEGSATMRVNNALTPDEVAEGWVLTCQAIPTTPTLTIEYESF